MKIQIPEYIQEIFKKLHHQYPKSEVYIVGGCVRDSIIGLTPHDYDITTNLTPDEIKSCFENRYIFNNNGLKHGTVSVLQDSKPVEITTYRKEGNYIDGRRPEHVDFTTSLEEDLKRRDFTINAMAYNDETGLVDPYGGVSDILNRVIRAVGNPYERFNEDYLRILRALRFASKLEYQIESNTSLAILDTYRYLNRISKERIKKELEGILVGPGVEFILREYKDIMKEIIPPLEGCDGFIQNNKYHIHQNLYEHIIHVVKYTKNDFITRISALLHDIGKPDCYTEEYIDGKPQGHFYNHAVKSAEITRKVLNDLRFSNDEITSILYLVKNHDCDLSTRKSIKKVLSKAPNQDYNLFLKLVDLRLCDQKDHQNLKKNYQLNEVIEMAKEIIASKDALSIKDLKIDGHDMISLGATGSQIGTVIHHLFELVLNEQIKNDREILLSKAKLYLDELKESKNL